MTTKVNTSYETLKVVYLFCAVKFLFAYVRKKERKRETLKVEYVKLEATRITSEEIYV